MSGMSKIIANGNIMIIVQFLDLSQFSDQGTPFEGKVRFPCKNTARLLNSSVKTYVDIY